MRTTVAHTADLPPALLPPLREFLFDVFGEHYSEDAYDHALGGMHVLVTDDEGRIAGHGCVVARRMLHGGRALRCGYVESVAVSPDHRRRGVASTVMTELRRLIEGGYALGALSSSPDGLGLYPSLGWTRWRGPLSVLRPAGGVTPNTGDDAVFVLDAGAGLDLDGELTCDWRDGKPW